MFSTRPVHTLYASVVALLFMALPARAADVNLASQKGHSWLVSQIQPSGLVDSYKDRSDVCYTYDQAVAAVAFLSRGDSNNARRVLQALKALQNADGSWYHSYTCKSPRVLSTSRYVGAVSWVALAMAHYEVGTGDQVTFRNSAERAVNWALMFLKADGGLNGGYDVNGVPIAWASTEHNEDAHGALGFFQYSEQNSVRGFLDNVVYNVGQQRWNQGRNDTHDPLDVNPLGVLALGSTGTHNYWRSLDFSLQRHRSTQSYKRGRIRLTVDGFDFNNDRNDIWFEGTAQMVLALRVAGRFADGNYFLQEIIKAQQDDGGVPYSLKGTNNGDFTMSTASSVAATGWLVIAAQNVNPMRPVN